jgi:Pao retrotransposon peptidase
MISSIFDPLGLVSPFIFPAKRLLQELCRKNIGWDDKIPDAEFRAWQSWQQDHLRIQELKIDRCLQTCEFSETISKQLHHFCDASRDGYGTASYMRAIDSSGNISCQLLMAKSRFAPVKSTTIPRLELQAATLAVKMDELIYGELDASLLQKSVVWTDSTVVLQYINSIDKRFHTFVANRVAVIHERTEPSQ